MTKILRYAGIGSRETPFDICSGMTAIASLLGNAGWHLRSGFAAGADQAFFVGAQEAGGNFTNFIPWKGFNSSPKDPRWVVPNFTCELMDIAASHHPAWNRCSDMAKRLHARNVCQVLGMDLKTPVEMVICWTQGGKGQGGTGQAIRIAQAYGVPVFDLAIEGQSEALEAFVNIY